MMHAIGVVLEIIGGVVVVVVVLGVVAAILTKGENPFQ